MFAEKLLIGCLLGLLGCAAEAQQEAPVGDCDRYAASEYGETGPGVSFEKINPKVAIPACQEAVTSNPNSLRFLFELGRAHLKAGDYGVALQLLRKAADQGYAPAQGSIGSMYLDAKGVPKDEREAFVWHSKAAQQGFAGSQMSLGFMYEKGIGVRQNHATALSWYRKAADQGVPPAQDSVGYFYAKGLGVKRDDRMAVDWLTKAALQGMAGAEYNLGTMYEAGSGVPQNRSVALNWYKKAADQGNAEAMRKLATSNTATQSNDPNAPQMTEIKRKAAASCWSKNEIQVNDCYNEALKGYRGHPNDLLNADVRDAVAYCGSAAESNDSEFCSTLRNQYSALFTAEFQYETQAAARDHQRQQAEQAKLPKFVSAKAVKLPVVPGAIICADHDTVALMYDLYSAHWSDTMQDKLTNGQSQLLRGKATSAPDLEAYGCSLILAGTPMTLERGNIVPVVSVKLPNGKVVRGVTLQAMITTH
jgi:TPR repeat protein